METILKSDIRQIREWVDAGKTDEWIVNALSASTSSVQSFRSRNDIEKLLSAMTRAEKAQLLQLVASDLGDASPGIESTPGVCGGEPRIVRTRIPVWVLEQARRLGASEVDLLRAYPTLRAEDLVHAWAYMRAPRRDGASDPGERGSLENGWRACMPTRTFPYP